MPFSFRGLRDPFARLSGPPGDSQTGTGRLQGQSLCGGSVPCFGITGPSAGQLLQRHR
jgi:hypothetical protein